MESFLSRLAEILDVGSVAPESVLRDFPDWDSLTVLSIQSMIDEAYGAPVLAGDIAQITTAGQLAALVEGRRTK